MIEFRISHLILWKLRFLGEHIITEESYQEGITRGVKEG